MKKGRLEAFSDGVMAIIITIMVLELDVPAGGELAGLLPVLPVFLSYVLSFLFVGIYWNNHHHLFQAVEKVDGRVLLANLHLLFWLSLIPFSSRWMGETRFETWPVVVYGAVMLLSAVAYFLMVRTLLALHGPDSLLAMAMGSDFKGRISVVIQLAAIGLAFVNTALSAGLFLLVVVIWILPDRRIERTMAK